MSHARCAKCLHWFHDNQVIILSCPACQYITARCHKCGGRDGALRSIFNHFTYWRVRQKGDGGHLERMKKWTSTVKKNILKLVA